MDNTLDGGLFRLSQNNVGFYSAMGGGFFRVCKLEVEVSSAMPFLRVGVYSGGGLFKDSGNHPSG